MLRSRIIGLPVVLAATGILLSACASSGAISARPDSPVGSATPFATPDGAAAPVRSATPTTPAPVPDMTASSWAEMLTSGALTPTATPPAPAPGKVVYLTFDDGPSAQYTKKVLSILDAYDAKATFFVIGRQTAGAKQTLRAEYAAGHGVANHTWDHKNLRGLSWKKFAAQVGRTQTAITEATGHAPTCLRPPGGASDKWVRKRAAGYKLQLKFWTVDTYDWKLPGAKRIVHRAKAVRNGSIVLLHDGGGNRAQTVKALPKILRDLKAKGYTFKAMCR